MPLHRTFAGEGQGRRRGFGPRLGPPHASPHHDRSLPPPRGPLAGAYDALVVLAVHSRAPLLSFWSSLPTTLPRLCVSIPCCGDYGWLSTSDLRERYVDREVDCPVASTVLVYERKAGD